MGITARTEQNLSSAEADAIRKKLREFVRKESADDSCWSETKTDYTFFEN